MSQLRQHEDRWEALGVAVAIVTFQAGPVVEAYVHESKLTWPLLVDEKLSLYSAYGMHHGRVWDVWGPPSWWAYAKLFARGRMLRMPHGDVNQLGGDVLIDPAGIVRLHHVGSGPADRPPIGSLLKIVEDNSAAG